MNFSPTNGYQVRYAPGIHEKMCASVGAFEPEHYAILGGHLDDPFHITDFMPMPPSLNQHGGYRSSSATVTLNGPFIEYYLNTCLTPFGKYILGAMHSHPGDMVHLSGGAPGSGYGDIPSMRSHLEAAARFGEPWHNFIAPIVTRPGPSPRVTTWIIRLDRHDPVPAETIWETESPATPPAAAASEIDEILDLVRYRPELVRAILQRSDRLSASLRSHRPRDERQARLLMQRIIKNRAAKKATHAHDHRPHVMTLEELAGLIPPPFFGPISR